MIITVSTAHVQICDIIRFVTRNWGVAIQKENEAYLGPETRREENVNDVSAPHLIPRLESVASSPRQVQGRAPTEDGFIVI